MNHPADLYAAAIDQALARQDRPAAIDQARQAGLHGIAFPVETWIGWIAEPTIFVGDWVLHDWCDALLTAPIGSDGVLALQCLASMQRDGTAPLELVDAVRSYARSDFAYLLAAICFQRLWRWELSLLCLDLIDLDGRWRDAALYYRLFALVQLHRWHSLSVLYRDHFTAEPDQWAYLLRTAYARILNAMDYDLATILRQWMAETPGLPNVIIESSTISAVFLQCLIDQPDPARLMVEAQAHAARLAQRNQPMRCAWDDRDRQGHPARIGYLWNFGGGFLDLPVLAHSDPDRYHTIFYLGLLAPADAPAGSSNLRGLHGLSDDQALAVIQADDLDVLVILDSLGYFSRDDLVARRPARRLAFWGNLFHPTCLPFVDAILLPERSIPSMAALGPTETLIPLPNGLHLSGGADQRILPPQPLPAGPPVIGSVASAFKLTQSWFSLVERILAAVPDAVLRLDVTVVTEDQFLRILDLIERAGIDLARIDLRHAVGNNQFPERMAPLWLAIDSAPFSCYYTAVQALSTGLPLLTAPGPLPVSHLAAAILTAIGLEQWIFPDTDALIAQAVALLRDPAHLADLRQQAAAGVRASMLADLPASARAWDQALADVLALPVRG